MLFVFYKTQQIKLQQYNLFWLKHSGLLQILQKNLSNFQASSPGVSHC